MIIPCKFEPIRKYTPPRQIVYDPKENYSMAKLLKYKKASFPSIYTLRTKKQIWDAQIIHNKFSELCSKITLPSFLAWKELGKSGWHIHVYGTPYNFKNKWKGYVTYKKFKPSELKKAMDPIYYNSYFSKLGLEGVYDKLGKYGLDLPKFHFRWYGENYFKVDGKWVTDKYYEMPEHPNILKKKSTLYIDLKIIITFCGESFLKRVNLVKDIIKHLVIKIEAYAFKRRKVISAIMSVDENLKVELYMPNLNKLFGRLVIEKLKWLLLEIFKSVGEFIKLNCYATNTKAPPNLIYRLVNKKSNSSLITCASSYSTDFNSENNLLRLLGRKVEKYFVVYLKCKNLKLEGGREIASEIRKELVGKLQYCNLKYCEVIIGTFRNRSFKKFMGEYSTYHPTLKYNFYNWGIMPFNYSKALKGMMVNQ